MKRIYQKPQLSMYSIEMGSPLLAGSSDPTVPKKDELGGPQLAPSINPSPWNDEEIEEPNRSLFD